MLGSYNIGLSLDPVSIYDENPAQTKALISLASFDIFQETIELLINLKGLIEYPEIW